MAHALAHYFDAAARGEFPPVDGVTEVLPSPGGSADALIAFTGHFVLAADIDAAEVATRAPVGEFSVPLSPEFLQWVGRSIGSFPGTHDALFVATAEVGVPEVPLELIGAADHPRVRRAERYRRDVRVYGTPDGAGVVIVGRGLTNRWEVAFEIDDAERGRGLGRKLCAAARNLLPPGTPVWAQVAPGNAASMRTVYAAGFRPVGAEVLFAR